MWKEVTNFQKKTKKHNKKQNQQNQKNPNEVNISCREGANTVSIKTCAEGKIPKFFLIQMQGTENTAHEGLMANSKNVYLKKGVGYSVWRRKENIYGWSV